MGMLRLSKKDVRKPRYDSRLIGRHEQLESRQLLAGDLVAQWQADSLVGEFSMGDTVSAWSDRVNLISAKTIGTPTLVAGDSGRGMLRFDAADGVDGFRVTPSDNPTSNSAAFSSAVVFSTDDIQSGPEGQWFQNTALVDSSELGFSHDWGIAMNASGAIGAGLGDGFGNDATTIYSNISGLNDGRLHTAILVRDSSALSLYVDGVLAASTATASTEPRHNKDLAFGMSISEANGFTGLIGEVRFYDGALSQSEVANVQTDILAFYDNSRPVAVDDQYQLNEDDPLFFASAINGVLANDLDADGDVITASLVDPPRHGTLDLSADGSFVYSPERDFHGVDFFTYVASDHRPSDVATVQLQVDSVYDPAIAVDDSYKLQPGDTLTIPAFVGVLLNDLNPDNAELSVVLENDVEGGQLALRPDGSFRYDSLDFAGTTSFSYRIADGTGLSRPATVELIVNSAPVANDDIFEVNEDQTLIVTQRNGLFSNDVDNEMDTYIAVLEESTRHGELALSDDGSFIYVPNANFFGDDQFTYRIRDEHDLSRAATVAIKVNAVNDRPQATPDAYYVATDGIIEADFASGLLRNDTDIDSTLLAVEIVTRPSNGELSNQPDGSFVYVPNGGFVGQDSFTYQVADEDSLSDPVAVTFFVGTSPVRISEFMAANVSVLETRLRAEPDDRFRGATESPDWLEIENVTSADFDISGFQLSDRTGADTAWTFPNATIVPSDGRLVVLASGRNIIDTRLDELGLFHTDFSISIEAGGVLHLSFPDGRVAQTIEYPQQFADVSFGLSDTGTMGYLLDATPSESNSMIYDGALDSVEFSHDRGFYDEAFEVTLSSSSPAAAIRYTTDGSAPTVEHGSLYDGPITVATTTTLRAAAFQENRVPSEVVTNSFLFLDDVIEQPFRPEGYPSEWAGMPADYGMDPDVVGTDNLFNDIYRNSVVEDLKALPTLSLSFAPDDFFGQQGIYQNPTGTGDRWERPVSVELISPDGSEPGFHLNSGIRVMGGSSRQPDIPKHSLRLEFREAYGAGKLNYPLFDDTPYSDGVTQSFDELVVRVGFNNSWMHRHYYQSLRGEQPRDQWVRDMHMAMGQPGARGEYVHVYLNGMYWGIYNLHERPAAPFMEEYFGGDKDTEWNVINSNEAIDGNVRPWSQVLGLANRGLAAPEDYAEFQEEVDLVSLADYMMLNFYVGNTDWDGHNWISARRNSDDKWRFYAWDSEFAISLPPSNAAIGANAENQIINVDRTAQNSGNGPSRLHTRAAANEEYRMLFADRVHKHFFNSGVLTPETATQIFSVRSDEIDRAVVAESARWGDFRRDVNPGRWRSDQFDLYHRDEHYVNQKAFITERYLPVRTDIVLNQLRRRNLYPDVVAPSFSQHGGRIHDSFELLMTAPEGTIYYTIDGTDPRKSGGEVSNIALVYDSAVNLDTSATVMARVRLNGEWSALNEAFFQLAEAASSESLRVTEVHYHPADPTPEEVAAGFSDADEFEFIEFANVSNQTIDLSDVRLVRATVDGELQGVDFAFADGVVLELKPRARVVVVENIDAFEARYGSDVLVAGQWSGQLSNQSEQLTVSVGDQVLQQFRYSDEWHPETDGNGSSLEIIDAAGRLDSWNQSTAWRPSLHSGGTPGISVQPGDSNHDGIFNSSDLVLVFQAGEYEDGINGNSTFEEGDWDGNGDFDTRDFVFAFQAGHYVAAAVFDELFIDDPAFDEPVFDDTLINDAIFAGGLLDETLSLPSQDRPRRSAIRLNR